ncbi:MAG: phosphotransferase [Planctomycetes bacterium]|nr:phosphotransferase [Planctomycetota bacterium]
MSADSPARLGAFERLLSRSAARTVYVRQDADGSAQVVKRFERGSPDDARREFELGRLAAGAGLVEFVALETCPDTRRPMVVTTQAPGVDLGRRLRRDGPPLPSLALAWAEHLAQTLARLAAIRRPEAPLGVVHGDVKPSNLLVDDGAERRVTLIDFEHAALAAPGGHAAGTFTGGTHGYAPPEAYTGAMPTAAFDVFAFGCVLHELLLGRRALRTPRDGSFARAAATGVDAAALDGLPADLAELLLQCLAPEPAARPPVASLAARVATCAPGVDAALADLVAWQRGDLAGGERLAAAATGAVQRRWSRRRAVAGRLAPLPDVSTSSLDAAGLGRRARRLCARLRWFPRHERLRADRETAHRTLDALLRGTPEQIAELVERGRLDLARRVLDGVDEALRHLGPPPASLAPSDRAPHVTDRDPLTLLSASRRDLEREASEIEGARRDLAAAIARLDLRAARTVVETIVRHHGGSRTWVAELRDRLLRFEFYAERVQRRTRAVDALRELSDALDLGARLERVDELRRTLARALASAGTAADAATDGDPGDEDARTRPLLGALRDVLRDFPELEPRLAPVREELLAFCATATDRAWELAADAEAKLVRPPIPIRPLETQLVRLDTLLHADVIVDRDGHTRIELVDEVESLRARVEEARSARDRIARGAQEAMDRGHLTTAIFDMERAVDRFAATEDEADREHDLARQFEEAKRRKREVEEALQRNHRLAARCAAVLADPQAGSAARIAALQERETVLAYLCRGLPADRAAPFQDDLRAVHAGLLRETGIDGEARLRQERDPRRRLAIAREVLDSIRHLTPEAGLAREDAAPARELLDTWRAHCDAETARCRALDARAARRGPSLSERLGNAVARLTRGRRPQAHPEAALGDPEPLRVQADQLAFDADAALRRLRAFAARLRQAGAAAAADDALRLLDAVRADDGALPPWAEVAAAGDDFASAAELAAADDLRRQCDRFRERALRTAFAVRVAARQPGLDAGLLRRDAALRRSLSVEDADVLTRFLELG